MKYIYNMPDLRIKVSEGTSICGHPQLTLKLQRKRKLLFLTTWDSIRHLDIELKEYWTPFGDKTRTERPIRLGYVGGGELECWYPEHFNLEKRVKEIFSEYHESQKAKLKAKMAMGKHLSSIREQ